MSSNATSNAHHAISFGPFNSPALGTCFGVNIAPSRRTPQTEGSVWDRTAPGEGEPIISLRRKVPTPGVVITSAARRLIELSRAGEKIDSIVMTGNKEATSHPELIEIIENLRELRDKWFSKATLCLVSESLDVDAPHLRHALSMFDRPIVRFEWGTAKVFTSATGRPGTDLKRIVDALTGLDKLVLQATFSSKAENSSDAEIKNWVKKVGEIRPRSVLLGTLGEKPEGKSRAKGKAPPPTELEAIAAQVTEKTAVPVQVIAAEAVPV